MKNKTCIFLSTFLQHILVGLNSIANLIFPTPLVEVCALEDRSPPFTFYIPLILKYLLITKLVKSFLMAQAFAHAKSAREARASPQCPCLVALRHLSTLSLNAIFSVKPHLPLSDKLSASFLICPWKFL